MGKTREYCFVAVVLTLTSIVSRAKEQVSCDVGGETAVLNLANGAYYGLDAVGTRIWSLLAEPKTVSQIRAALLQEYQVIPERCERDLWRFLSELAEENLVEVRGGPGEGCQELGGCGDAAVPGQTGLAL